MRAKPETTACLTALASLCLVLAVMATPATCHAFEIAIEISPRTLNLDSEGEVVTVHTDIPYGDVDVSAVYLNGVSIDSWKADDRGDFVAKFLMDDIKTLPGLIIGGDNTLQLVGLTNDVPPVEFWGAQEVLVIDRGRGDSPAPGARR